MICPNCDLSGWHVEAGDIDYRIVDENGATWCNVKKNYQAGAQERAHLIAELLSEAEKHGNLSQG